MPGPVSTRKPTVTRERKGTKREANALRLLHVSDVHAGTRFGAVPTHEILRHAAAVARAEGRILIVSGDLTENGAKEEMRLVRAALKATRRGNCFVVPGNHDYRLLRGNFGVVETQRARFDAAFARWYGRPWTKGSYFPYVASLGTGYLLVGLDSNRGGVSARGLLGEEQLAVLKRLVGSSRYKHWKKIVVMHHAPRNSGRLHGLDGLFHDLDDAKALRDCIMGNRVTILHGHLHTRGKNVLWKGQGEPRGDALQAPSLKVSEGVNSGMVFGERLDLLPRTTTRSRVALADKFGLLPRLQLQVSCSRLRGGIRVSWTGCVNGVCQGRLKVAARLFDGQGRALPVPSPSRNRKASEGSNWSLRQRDGQALAGTSLFPWVAAEQRRRSRLTLRVAFGVGDLVKTVSLAFPATQRTVRRSFTWTFEKGSRSAKAFAAI